MAPLSRSCRASRRPYGGSPLLSNSVLKSAIDKLPIRSTISLDCERRARGLSSGGGVLGACRVGLGGARWGQSVVATSLCPPGPAPAPASTSDAAPPLSPSPSPFPSPSPPLPGTAAGQVRSCASTASCEPRNPQPWSQAYSLDRRAAAAMRGDPERGGTERGGVERSGASDGRRAGERGDPDVPELESV